MKKDDRRNWLSSFWVYNLFPLLYVSSFDGGDYINVYDIGHTEQRGYYADLVQVIDLTSVNNSIIGKSVDAVVDVDNNTLITHGYLIDVYETTGNKSCFATINLPLLSDGSVVVITDNDIQDNFQTDVLNFTQDKCYYDGKIYINRGDLRYQEWLRLSVVDLTTKQIITQIDLSRWGGEPEGIDVYKNDKLLTTYGYSTIYEYIFL